MQRDLTKKTLNIQSKFETFPKVKKRITSITLFGYEHKEKYPIYVSKQCCEQKDVDLLLIAEGVTKTFCSYQRFQ